MLRMFAAVSLLILASCSERGQIRYMPEAAGIGKVERVFVGTTRADDGAGEIWSAKRSAKARYARFDISIPPERELGSVPWPAKNATPNPNTDMVTIDRANYATAPEFRSALNRELVKDRRGQRDAVVFVHGFNNTFAEGLYRFAQLYHDLEIPGVPVHYAWPSRGSVLGYAYDRDSTLFARDGLEDLLKQVSAAGADRILLIAHSMGSALTMETLRFLNETPEIRRKLNGVILMSPDVDLDVFKSQARRIGKLPQPFVVLTSNRDGALALSARLAGETSRLGNLQDPKELAGLDVTLVETGKYTDGSAHFPAATSPALIRLLSSSNEIASALGADDRSRVGILPGAVLTVQGVTQKVLDPVVRFGERQ